MSVLGQCQGCSFWPRNFEGYKESDKGSAKPYKQVAQKNTKIFWPNVISNEELLETEMKAISGSVNRPAEMEVNRTYTDEEFL